MKPYRAILYLRQASAAQTEFNSSIQQEILLKNYCAIHGIRVIGFYNDVTTGKSMDRPGFKKLLDFLEQNKEEVYFVLFTSWDRLSRDYRTATKMIEKLEDLGVKARTIQQSIFFLRLSQDEINLN